MQQQVTTAIVLARTNFGEADRILTVITPEYGKLRLMARGVRKVKSKLAGGIELFSVSNVTFVQGRGEIGTLISARLLKHYGHIVSGIERVQLGYELIKLLNRTIEDEAEKAYFELLEQAFQALDDPANSDELIRAWFIAQLLRLGGRMPNLQTDSFGEKLDPNAVYEFDLDAMSFVRHDQGQLTAAHIKFMRLIFSGTQPKILRRVGGAGGLTPVCAMLVSLMWEHQI